MADTLLDGGFSDYPDAWEFVLSFVSHSTTPVTSGEIGIVAELADLEFPPFYQGGPAGADDVLDALGQIIFGNTAITVIGSAGLSGRNGALCPLYDDDLYGRIILQPVTLDFGNVLQQSSKNVEIWNSFRVSKTLDNIAEVETLGLTLIRPVSAPTEPAVYAPLQSRVYTVQTETTGPASIDALYTFDFLAAGAVILSVTGTRVIAFPFCYERPVRETLEFRTDIIRTYDGNEQRISSRTLPRQNFRCQYLFTEDKERQRVMNALFGFHGKFFAVPLFHWARPLTADASINDTTIFVDHADADFRDTTAEFEHLVMIWRASDDFEIAQIALNGLATPGQIDIELPLTQDHDAGVIVAPMQFALAKDPITFEETQNNIVRLNANWLSNDYADLADLSSLPTLGGIPVLGDPNLIQGTLSQGLQIRYSIEDSTTGDFRAFAGRTVPETKSFLGIEVATEAEAWVIREVIYGLKGKQKTFWLPTFRNDFIVTQNIGAADLSIVFEENDFHRFVEGAPAPWDGVYIELFDGTTFVQTLDDTTAPVAGEEAVVLRASIGTAITVPEIRKMSLLVRSRFNQDRIIIQHNRIGNITLRIPVVGVKESG